ncbi:MAG: site-specific integrase [Prevotella sp.]|nr:site-specific integrase [Prevotella sp.]
MLYKTWLADWLTNYVMPSVKDKTYTRYADIVDQHLVPKLGDYEIEDLTPIIVQRYITELMQSGNLRTGKGLSANSINSIITVIQGSMSTAHLLGLVSVYEMNKLKRPKNQEKPIEVFTPNEQKQIEHAVLTDKREKMKGVVICLYTGLRIGELLALEWEDIDFGKAELTVSKTCHDGKNKNGDFCRITETPKTANSRRTIALPKQLLPILREMKKKSKSRLVISGDKPLFVRSYQRSFELLLKNLGIPRRGFHVLRHTFATRAIECGMDVKTLSETLGHKNASITLNRYVHSLMEHKHSMMDKVGKNL